MTDSKDRVATTSDSSERDVFSLQAHMHAKRPPAAVQHTLAKWLRCSWSTFVASLVLLLGCFAVFTVAMEMDFAVSSCSLELPKSYFFTPSTPIVLRDDRFALKDGNIYNQPLVLTENATLANGTMCIPGVLDLRRSQSLSGHRFYAMLKAIAPLPPPIFAGHDMQLCNETACLTKKFEYCLPISGRKDEPFCNGPDRMDLFARGSAESRCYASVLHMLTADVYEVLKADHAQPILIFETLLGAVRTGSTLPFAPNASLAYMKPPSQTSGKSPMQRVQMRLWGRGYHMFLHDDKLWRVCVAPTHPLASNLYDPKPRRTEKPPHLTLHEMKRAREAQWWIERDTSTNHRRISQDKFYPFSSVKMNGVAYDTVADPQAFLVQEYGEDYLTSKPRS